ncbi:MAG: phosphopentomutase [Candidatus Sabulitectum sp.]|nr:phosphopentomutase [Candidatus Sabulitectum sp.]
MKKAVVLVLDGVGIGEMPDAGDYGDCGSDTLGNTARAVGGLCLPNMRKMGLGNIHPIPGVKPVSSPVASWGKMHEMSKGKDSTTGHWEIMGLVSPVAMPTFPSGFPQLFIDEFSTATGHVILGNEVASGTEIIQRLGKEQVRTAGLIVYTSADSVFQIAAHESVVPVNELYRCCEIARQMLLPPDLGVSRVIARPFTGKAGEYFRTPRRKDFSVPPPGETLLDTLVEKGIAVTGVGKIDDLFNHRNIETEHTADNAEGMNLVLDKIRKSSGGLIFANLCDFDSKWGHRNNYLGFAQGLADVDIWMPELLESLDREDILIITADHGNDPTTPSTDHSREFVPLLVYSPGCSGVSLEVRSAFSDIACTLAEFFQTGGDFPGRSFLKEVRCDIK